MNIYSVLETLEKEVTESKPLPWPMQERSVVNRDRLLRILEKSRECIPQEVKHARWVTRETERIAQESETRAERTLREAESRKREMLKSASCEIERLTNKESVVTQARAQAEAILVQAEQEAARKVEAAEEYARDVRGQAERFALQIFSGMENELEKILQISRRGKESLNCAPGRDYSPLS